MKKMRLTVGVLGLLLASQAFASFGMGGVGFLDRFLVIGLLFGALGGFPVTAIVFAVLSILMRSKRRMRLAVGLTGAVFGCASWLIAAAVMAAALQVDSSGKTNFPESLAAGTLIALAIASAVYARSAPAAAQAEAAAES